MESTSDISHANKQAILVDVDFVDPKILDSSIDMLAIRFEALEVSASSVRAMVWETRNEGLYDFLRDFASMFPIPALGVDRNVCEIVECGLRAWNAYPHAGLGGDSPQRVSMGR